MVHKAYKLRRIVMSNDTWICIFFCCFGGYILYELISGPGIVRFGMAVTGLSAPTVFFLWFVVAGLSFVVGVLAAMTPSKEDDE